LQSKAKAKERIFRPRNTGLCSSIFRRVCVRSHVRAYRSASRSTFAHSSGDGSGGSDDSGESDSGDPPRPSLHTALLNLSQPFFNEPNSSSRPWRYSRCPGCWRLPHCNRFLWRWLA
jgi:hypothetical protein